MGTFVFFILATLQDHERLLSAHYSLLQTLYPLPCSTTPSIHFPLHFRSAGLCENELLTAHLKKVLDVFNHTTSPLIALNHGEKSYGQKNAGLCYELDLKETTFVQGNARKVSLPSPK